MKQIILASKSQARRKLLKTLGLKFKVIVSKVKESKSLPKSLNSKKNLNYRYKTLVVSNALKKVSAVAKKFNSGLVIGLDTMIFVGNTVIGKPKDLKDAVRILNLLSQNPQWVYTGMAVIDIDSNKMITDYSKTKIYMQKLSSEQINNYFKRVSPLDKAGGFDIQGLGGIFVDRIEGCFYNVVGLPLAKLVKILEKLGIKVI